MMTPLSHLLLLMRSSIGLASRSASAHADTPRLLFSLLSSKVAIPLSANFGHCGASQDW
jgi:hypothetical protein